MSCHSQHLRRLKLQIPWSEEWQLSKYHHPGCKAHHQVSPVYWSYNHVYAFTTLECECVEGGGHNQVSPVYRSYNSCPQHTSVLGGSHSAGSEIALSWSPMRLTILHWRPEFHNWSPAGDLTIFMPR